jgi:hypothetical protein
VELDEPKFCAGHGVLPVVDVLLPDLQGAVLGIRNTHAPLSKLIVFIFSAILFDEGVTFTL